MEISSGRRLGWVNWLTAPNSRQQALLARVTVNRAWQEYFGTGICATPDNLGLSGAKPTHPELLEWLAAKFVESGWSMKSLHRLILQSATFRQSSASRSSALVKDPSNVLLWRFPPQRLDAESIRDGMLAACGRLDTKSSGPYVPITVSASGEIVVDETKTNALARSMFLQQRRTQVPTLLANFDAPSVVFNCTRRGVTTMPLQSLSLLNSDFAVKRAHDLAARLERDCGSDSMAKIDRAFLLTAGRMPDAIERKSAQSFIAEQQRSYEGKSDVEQRVWSDFCQSLFASNLFLYVE